MSSPLEVTGLEKTFTMHLRGGLKLPVMSNASSPCRDRRMRGARRSLRHRQELYPQDDLRQLCRRSRRDFLIMHEGEPHDIATASPRQVLDIRRKTLGYVSQFLRTVPRVGALDIVAEPLTARGMPIEDARTKAAVLLERLNLPDTLWQLPPATFSGGEQQRVNIARGFTTDHPVLLLDEPTASLDAANRAVVVEMIRDKKEHGVALLGIFHDEDVRAQVADRIVDVSAFSARKAAA